ncbi:site-specific integrase [Metamycoplasma gateae]|uniref:Site-specific integrase n=1 Tax=Metamycoplasma gateae TaxID=35769 RepID=A0ABZ2AMC1_9BACT|nr:site-specific integrase [Metamycoplasma gateae]
MKNNPTNEQKEKFFQNYFEFMDKKQCTKNTKDMYLSFFKFLKDLDWSNAEEMCISLKNKYDNKRTYNLAISISKAFFNFLNKKQLFFLDTTELMRAIAIKKIKPAYNEEYFLRLEKYLNDFGDDKFSFVWYTLKYNWCRVGEFAAIDWDYFKNNLDGSLIIQAEKKNNERIIKIPEEAKKYWSAWISWPWEVSTIINKFNFFRKFVYEKDEEFRTHQIKISAHCLRTSGITKAAILGLEDYKIAAMTGHKTTETIKQHYINLNQNTIEGCFEFTNTNNVIDQFDNEKLNKELKIARSEALRWKVLYTDLMRQMEWISSEYNINLNNIHTKKGDIKSNLRKEEMFLKGINDENYN